MGDEERAHELRWVQGIGLEFTNSKDYSPERIIILNAVEGRSESKDQRKPSSLVVAVYFKP